LVKVADTEKLKLNIKEKSSLGLTLEGQAMKTDMISSLVSYMFNTATR